MIYFWLFLTFFEIGAVSFGGGYGMISMVREKVIENGWLTEGEFLNMIAVSESTPGPIAVNMATFVGSHEGGMLGSLCATLGVILPAFLIILCIASLIRNFLKYEGVKAFLSGVRPTVVGLIVSTGLTMLLGTLLGVTTFESTPSVDIRGSAIFVIIVALSLITKKIKKKKPSPIIMILISAVLGLVFYSF